MIKQKLTVLEQIEYMKNKKNIKFDNFTEQDAMLFLFNKNYFFKIKSYAKLFEKFNNVEDSKKYKDLQFEILVELSKLDCYLRRNLFSMTLAIEHALKIELLNSIARDPLEDGYIIMKNFFNKYPNKKKSLKNIIKQDNYSSEIIKRHYKNFAIWNYVEVIDFGTFELLYGYYYKNKPIYNKSEIINYLWNIRKVRNACAHNNCLLVSLNRTSKNNKHYSYIINEIDFSQAEKKILKSFLFKDLIIVFIVFFEVVKSSESKKNHMGDLKELLEVRAIKNKNMFNENKNDERKLIDAYRALKKIVDYYYNLV